jgi:hypothetical protein
MKNIFKQIFDFDSNNRKVYIYRFSDCQLVGHNLFYPNCRIKEGAIIHNPIDEQVMSLRNIKVKSEFHVKSTTSRFEHPLFFFIYNTDNYYHFLYDTLPYLISFRILKEDITDVKLLMNYPNHQSNKFYPFVKEMLELLEIKDEDIIIASDSTIYSDIYVSSSYTHGIDSNLPPRDEIYHLYNEMVDRVNIQYNTENEYPKKIYISRRTHLHNDLTNIGTNYTQKRKMENENELVEYLKIRGYEEIFTEKLSTIEKIKLFSNVESVFSAIGGGSCNVLFSKPSCKHYCIVSPTFLDVNYRFTFSLNKVITKYLTDTEHTEVGDWKKYMRVQCGDIIGEVESVFDDELLVVFTDKLVAGWNSEFRLNSDTFKKRICKRLDDGLNSSWRISNFEKIKDII